MDTNTDRIKHAVVPDASHEQQKCIRCMETKPFNEFSRLHSSRTGYINECKKCRNLKNHQQHLKHNWDLTVAEREAMLEKQGGRCAICRAPASERDLHIDHHHKTGLMRGLLCTWCNVALGHIKDDIECAKRMVEYLECYESASNPATIGKKCLRPHRVNRPNKFGKAAISPPRK